MQQCIKIFYLYEAQHVSGDTPPIIGSLKLHSQSLVLHMWRIVSRVVAGRWQRPATTWPTTLHVCKTRGCECSLGSRWWAACRLKNVELHTNRKFWYTVASCWIFYVNYTMMHGSTNMKFKSLYPNHFNCPSSYTNPSQYWCHSWQCPTTTWPTTLHVCKTRGC